MLSLIHVDGNIYVDTLSFFHILIANTTWTMNLVYLIIYLIICGCFVINSFFCLELFSFGTAPCITTNACVLQMESISKRVEFPCRKIIYKREDNMSKKNCSIWPYDVLLLWDFLCENGSSSALYICFFSSLHPCL